jgi:hypothetical protein
MGYGDDESVFDIMTLNGKNIFCTAADDNHNIRGFDNPKSDSFGNWVMIDSPELEYGKVMTALKNGDFYASSGPEIYSLIKDGDRVTVKCSEAEKILFITDSRKRTRFIDEEGKPITEATFEISDTYQKFRIVVCDKKGKKAYTQFYNVN